MVDTGIFADERVLRLYDRLCEVSATYFGGLFRATITRSGGNSRHASDYYMSGLNAIDEMTYEAQEAEAVRASTRFPDLPGLYKHGLLLYVKHLYADESPQRIRVQVPPFATFLHYYTKRLAASPALRTLQFFGLFGVEKKVLHTEAIRFALADCADGRVHENSVEAWLNHTAEPAAAAAPAEVHEIRPEDSVSQAGASTRSVRFQSPAPRSRRSSGSRASKKSSTRSKKSEEKEDDEWYAGVTTPSPPTSIRAASGSGSAGWTRSTTV